MEKNIVREIHINPQLLEQVAEIDGNLSNVISTALTMWLQERHRQLNCPFTQTLCSRQNSPCNDCSIMKNHLPR
jgi:hypothetical protein